MCASNCGGGGRRSEPYVAQYGLRCGRGAGGGVLDELGQAVELRGVKALARRPRRPVDTRSADARER